MTTNPAGDEKRFAGEQCAVSWSVVRGQECKDAKGQCYHGDAIDQGPAKVAERDFGQVGHGLTRGSVHEGVKCATQCAFCS